MASINPSIASLTSQYNLSKANKEMEASTYRLSSGNKIYQSSDDPAGMAVGTQLKSTVVSLQAALQNVAQAGSLLGLADSALQNIGDILQRQKALATQATSASLTDQARTYLNQELTSLTSEINRISTTTSFNGIHLIDGSMYGPSTLQTYTNSNATNASGTFTITTALLTAESVFFNGVTLTGRTTANMGTVTPEFNFDITLNATAATQMEAINTVIQNLLNYQGTSATVLTAKGKLAQMNYAYTSGNAYMGVTAAVAGIVGNGAGGTNYAMGSNTAAASGVKVNGASASGLTVSTSLGLGSGSANTVAIDGRMNGGTFSTGTNAYTGTTRYIAQGNVTDSILNSLTTSVQANTGVDVSQVSNNPSFVGNIVSGGGFSATYVAGNQVNLAITVGSDTYQARNIGTNPTANTFITFNSVQAGGGSFQLQLQANNGVTGVVDQTTANLVATRLNSALSGVSIYQMRDVQNYTAAGSVYPSTGGSTTIGDLQGSSFQFINSNFTNMQLQDIQITPPVTLGSPPTMSFVINGETYQGGYNANGAATPLTSTLAAGTYGFVSTTNPNNMLVFTYTGGGAATALDLSSSANTAGVKTSLLNAFGVNQGNSAASFQVGASASNSITVQIKSAQSTALFLDSLGVSQTVDISTLANATTSSTYITNAINSLTSIRAGVGALESRFNYASANLNSAIQNQDAARATFLDTDVSAESTKFAAAQVKLQASISVLSQANQSMQNLLKLIG